MVHEDVLGGGIVAPAALPVAAGIAATIVRPKAVIVAVKALIFGPVFVFSSFKTLDIEFSGTLRMSLNRTGSEYLPGRFASVFFLLFWRKEWMQFTELANKE